MPSHYYSSSHAWFSQGNSPFPMSYPSKAYQQMGENLNKVQKWHKGRMTNNDDSLGAFFKFRSKLGFENDEQPLCLLGKWWAKG
ncbi:hypothetical protein VNO77_03979 [Canavalia gladiata]|uniref:Uncharacterized protein n=1 Tax=Canavalia gladiata TaxID=3824 RepID=A0AAN9MVT5_CANGL